MIFQLISDQYNLHKLRKNQWQSPFELEKLQVKKLRVLAKHAYYNIDYYRKLFDRSGIKSEDIQTIQDLVKSPITTKKEEITNSKTGKFQFVCPDRANINE